MRMSRRLGVMQSADSLIVQCVHGGAIRLNLIASKQVEFGLTARRIANC